MRFLINTKVVSCLGWVKIGAGGDFKWLQVISGDLMTYINHNVMSCVGLENMHYTFYC